MTTWQTVGTLLVLFLVPMAVLAAAVAVYDPLERRVRAWCARRRR